MFMSHVDVEKYPEVKQRYRFEKIEPKPSANKEIQIKEIQPEPESKPEPDKFNSALDSGLEEFLDADSYEKKLEVLSMLHPRITDDMINTMAVSLDTEVKEGDIETRYNDIKTCLLTLERFECNRLR
jgi:hypothetical protein